MTAAAPFKVRVTGDTSGTLDAVHVTVELVDRAAPPDDVPALLATRTPTSGDVIGWIVYNDDGSATLGNTVASGDFFPNDLIRVGDVGYYTTILTAGLGTVDAGSYPSISTLDYLDLGSSWQANGVGIDGTTAVVCLSGLSPQGRLAFVDVSDPSALSLIATVDPAGLDYPYGIAIDGGVAYVGGARTLMAVDIATRATLGSVTVPAAAPFDDGLMTSVVIDGSVAYVAHWGGGGGGKVEAIDISTPSSMSVLGTLNTADTKTASSVALSGSSSLALHARGTGSSSQGILAVIDVSDPASMSVTGATSPAAVLRVNEPGHRIHREGDWLAVANGTWLTFVDDSNPAAPTRVASTFSNAQQVVDAP